MIRSSFLAALLSVLPLTQVSLAGGLAKGLAEQNSSTDVTAAQVNGTWKCRKNIFRIWALGGGKLQVAFDGIYEYKSPAGPSANMGTGAGVATISGDTAIFRPEGAEESDKITLRFTGGKLIAKQEGTCGFGHHVYADGSYEKVSGKKPKFDE